MVELPSLFFDSEKEELLSSLEECSTHGVKNALCENLYALRAARDAGLVPHGGAGLNVLNTPALEELRSLGLADATVSFELSMAKIGALGADLPRGIVAYGRLPLMRFRACPVRGRGGCGGCTGSAFLTDRRGTRFPVLCHGKRYGTLLNSVPLHIAGKPLADVDFLTLWFTLESPREVLEVIGQYRDRLPSPAPRTGGLYYRQLQSPERF